MARRSLLPYGREPLSAAWGTTCSQLHTYWLMASSMKQMHHEGLQSMHEYLPQCMKILPQCILFATERDACFVCKQHTLQIACYQAKELQL